MDLSDLIAAKRKAMLSSKAAAKKKLLEETTPKPGDKKDTVHDKDEEKNEAEDNTKDDEDSSDEDEDSSDEEEVDENEATANRKLEGDLLKHRAGKDDAEEDSSDSGCEGDDEEAAEQAKAAEYFQDEETPVTDRVFTELALSRPLLRGIAAMGFVQPTPIQSSVIPLALQGRDVCASAQTGSGKVSWHCMGMIALHCSVIDHVLFLDGRLPLANLGAFAASTEWPDKGFDFAPHARTGGPVHRYDGDVCQVYQHYVGTDYGRY
jgi:hypothetical protein